MAGPAGSLLIRPALPDLPRLPPGRQRPTPTVTATKALPVTGVDRSDSC